KRMPKRSIAWCEVSLNFLAKLIAWSLIAMSCPCLSSLSWSWMSLLVGRVCPGTRSWTTKRVGRGVAPQPTRCAVDDAFAPGRRVLDRGCSAEQTAGEKEIQVLHDHGAAAALAQLENRVLTTAADLVHEA